MSMMRTVVNDTTRIQWDNVLAEAQDNIAIAQRDAARTRFEAHRRIGGEVLERQATGAFKRVTDFNPEADELLLLPPVAGG